jgi:hypothetical protein
LALAALATLLEIKTLRIIMVAVELTVTTFVAELLVTSAVDKLDFVVLVKVFAIST